MKKNEKDSKKDKKSNKKVQIINTAKEILEVAYYDDDMNCFVMNDESYMDLIQINTKDLVSSADYEVEYDIMKFTKLYKMYADDLKIVAGDVLKVIDEIEDKPDMIILDPPRDGINPKALQKIIDFGVNNLVYISCKPTSLARDLEMLQEQGYRVEKACAVDMFPNTVHVETVVKLSR